MKKIDARETARLLQRPLAPLAHEVVRRTRTIEQLRARRRKLRRQLAKLDQEIREGQRMLKLSLQALEPINESDLQ